MNAFNLSFNFFSIFGSGSCGYDMDSYGLCGCDTDPLRIERIDAGGPAIASVESVFM